MHQINSLIHIIFTVLDKETQHNSLEQPRANGIMHHVWLNPKCFWYEW